MRSVLLLVIAALACTPYTEEVCPSVPAADQAPDVLGYHGQDRLGWNATERRLTPEVVRSRCFGKQWETSRFDDVSVDGRVQHPHLYASPLYVDDAGGQPMLIAATSNGFVYALAPFEKGRMLWKTKLVDPVVAPALDGGVALGILSTPIIDRAANTIYVTALDRTGWQAFAVDLFTGAVQAGWPVRIDDATLAPLNKNGPARFQAGIHVSQRGALALSPNRDRLYLTFGTFAFHGVGWLVAIDTRARRVASAFSSAPYIDDTKSNGGMWAAGGPAITSDGRIWMTTGNSPPGTADTPRTWGSSLLRFGPELDLEYAYTPYNYCKLDENNLDLSASAPLLVPETPYVAIGSKQGNVYLVDGSKTEPVADRRPPCSTDRASDRSFSGPVNVFGPLTDDFGEIDYAKMRTKPAYFRDASATPFLFVAGSTKAAPDSKESTAPGLARLRIKPQLAIDGRAPVTFVNPGSPIVSSDGAAHPIVWVVDAVARRSASLLDPATPAPILHAIDGETMMPLFSSKPGDLAIGGKYNTPLVARGRVFVGTDRIVAFGAP